jgi:hypothetical protein
MTARDWAQLGGRILLVLTGLALVYAGTYVALAGAVPPPMVNGTLIALLGGDCLAAGFGFYRFSWPKGRPS